MIKKKIEVSGKFKEKKINYSIKSEILEGGYLTNHARYDL